MQKLIAPVLAISLAVSASTAYAGGPVVIAPDEDVVVDDKPASSVGIVPLLLLGVVLCVALCGGNDGEEFTD